MSNQTSMTSIIRVAPIASLPKVRVFSLFAVAVMSTIILAGDAIGQGMAPVNPKFVEWQRRRAAEASRTQEPAAATNAQRRASIRKAATGLDDGVEEEEAGFGLVPTLMDMDYLADINAGVVRAPAGGFPSTYDLRAESRLTPVRDQGDYGTCWAHATMASLESGILGREGAAADFSENNMANLHGWDYDGFVDGGNALMSTAYLVRWGGPVAEASDPYPNPGGSSAMSPARHVQRVVWIPGKSDSLDNDAIKMAVTGHGTLYATYYHASSYSRSSTASYFYPKSHSSNHAVAIVGWDDDYPASNFKSKPEGNGAYLVRNSWGTGWGDNGYFWISYYDGVFARSTMYSFRNAEDSANYGKIYQYDPLGMVSAFSRSWGANIFTATGADKIAAVGFYALVPKTSYSLSIYTGCQTGRPTSGTCALTQSGTIDEPGYVTVPLSTAVQVASGARFSVVLNLTTSGYDFPHAIEYARTGITSGASAASGQSFYSSNGSSWTDLTSWNGTANFCIKAYAAAAVATPDLASVSVSGPATVESGKSARFSCNARYADGSERAVAATWSVVSGASYAAMASDGTLAAAETTVDRAVVIRASYSENGISKTGDWSLTITAGPPPAPAGLSATQGTETRAVRLSWEAVSGAENYAVYRGATASSANAAYLGVAEAAKFSDTTAVPGRDYWYFIKVRNSSGTGPFSEGAAGWRALSAPSGVSASDGASLGEVSVSWEASDGASFYRVLRADGFDAEPQPVSGWIEDNEWADATAAPGTVYWYSVVAATDSTGSRPSEPSVPDDGFRAVPVVPSSLFIDGDPVVASGETASYSAFVQYSNGTRGESPVSPTWTVTAGSVSRTGVVTAPVVPANADITLSASTTAEGVHVEGTKTITVTATMPAAPEGLCVVSATADGGVALAWDAVPGASSYRVFRAGGTGGSPVQLCVGNVSTNSFTDATAVPGVTYSYGVAAENAAGTGPQSASVEAAIPLAAPAGVSATNDRTNGVSVAWGAVAGATHYHVARATSADGAKTELGSWTAGLSYDDVPPAAGTGYFYFVQAATDDSGAGAGPWGGPAEGQMIPSRTIASLLIFGPDRVLSGGEAVYACAAQWSDGVADAVSPEWSVAPAVAGGFDDDGRFLAATVADDTAATVTAAYGGTTATKAVTVVAPVQATAEISNVTAAQRWPFSGLVDIDYTLATTPAGTRATVSVSATDHDHNRALAATTLSGDGADGPVEAGEHRLTWNLAADHPGFHAKAVDVSVEAVPVGIRHVTVAFDGNGGTPSAASASFTVGEPYGTLPSARRAGHTFAGWFTAADGGTQVTRDSTADENVATLYAHWTAKAYTVTLDMQGGGNGTASVTATYGAAMPAITVPTREGYAFGGYWTEANGGGTQYYDASGASARTWNKTSATTLYAKWTVNSYTVTFNANGGEGGTSASLEYGSALTAPAVIKTGYTFAGWVPEVPATVPASNATFTAQWTANTYTVAFDPQGGTNGTMSVTATYGSAMPAITIPTRDGYTFGGYYTSTDGSGTQYYTASGTGARTWDKTSATTLYAKWTAQTYTVTLNSQSGTGGTAAVTATYGSAMPAITVPTRAGYTFGGYYTETNGAGTQYYTASGASARTWDRTAVTTLYAKWTANSSGPTYVVIDLSGGANASSYPVTYMNEPPSGGFNVDTYKTTKLVLRRIEPGTFMMCGQYQTTLTRPYYIGIFEMTQKQYALLTGSNPSYFTGDKRPLESVNYNTMRGSSNGSKWPSSSDVDSSSPLGKLRARTGLSFDLPTEAQWEYACRAGTTSEYNNGGNTEADLKKLGRYSGNLDDGKGGYSGNHTTVGSYDPNAWGLYDMHGNVLEHCLDWSGDLTSPLVDPKGASSGTYRKLRGGGWYWSASSATSSSRASNAKPNGGGRIGGFRLCCPAEQERDKVQLWEGGPYWATTNIGAEEPEDYGLYFWWGDTVGYRRENDAWVASDGSSTNFSFSTANTPTYGKDNAALQSEGWTTSAGVLAPAHDAAHAHWGGDWRMPTKQELSDLNSKCDWTWTTKNGVSGYLVRGRGDYASSSIFLPAAGDGGGTSLLNAGSDGLYWSSVPYSVNIRSWFLYFYYSGYHDTYYFHSRYLGQSVRPVQGFAE